MHRITPESWRWTLLTLFALSGFCGLIYESIWSHYLRLMLGHAAYAQTLVLAIFMGGMALGAWITSRFSERWRHPLIAYAVVEAVVGLSALLFHDLFVRLLDLLYLHWIPALSISSATALKWLVAAAMILPQSILLGMTFPLMSAAVLRRRPRKSGETLALLYFFNSIGAVVGVLASGFLLIPRGGLPGTIAVAGLLNLGLAGVVWFLVRRTPDTERQPPAIAREESANGLVPALLLGAAFATGVASFFYEIGWIRMLSLVLGTTNQAFELMLSAFILGLALGGLWIRRRLDHLASPLRFAGHVQILMGSLAVLTLPIYVGSFDLMGYLVRSLDKTDRGYALFHAGSHVIALLVMLPATVMAGMTLPLFTYALLKRGGGERSIGRVYAANTVGAILGVLLAVHWIMPAIGTKGLIVAGGLGDIALGLLLLSTCRRRLRRGELQLAGGAAILLVALISLGVSVDPRRSASGVYRTGQGALPEDSEIVYHRDGKTATVALVRDPNGWMRITTNGKPDAQINVGDGPAAPDEATMVLLGALPLALYPEAEVVANIGMGSGMTTHVLLGSDRIRSVDTVEIEQAMVEAAREFGPLVERAYSDPRSRIWVEDAKTFFSSRDTRYDLIISEPSNPWVSGVSSLFSEEFYRHVAGHLSEDGLLVQWLQLYETNVNLLSSVFKALATEFDDYVVFHTDNANILVVAANGRDLGELDGAVFDPPHLRQDLERVGIRGLPDLEIRRLGSRALLHPVFAAMPSPANSDFHPFLSHEAPRSRFLGEAAVDITRLHVAPVPVLELIDDHVRRGPHSVTENPVFTPSSARNWAGDLLRQARWEARREARREAQPAVTAARPVSDAIPELYLDPDLCLAMLDESLLLDSLLRFSATVNPFLSGDDLESFWRTLEEHECYAGISPYARTWLELHAAVAARDAGEMAELSARLLASREPRGASLEGDPGDQGRDAEVQQIELEYLVAAGLGGALAQGRISEVRRFESWIAGLLPPGTTPPFYLRLLLEHAASVTTAADS